MFQGENSNEQSSLTTELEPIDKFLRLLNPIAGVDSDGVDVLP